SREDGRESTRSECAVPAPRDLGPARSAGDRAPAQGARRLRAALTGRRGKRYQSESPIFHREPHGEPPRVQEDSEPAEDGLPHEGELAHAGTGAPGVVEGEADLRSPPGEEPGEHTLP